MTWDHNLCPRCSRGQLAWVTLSCTTFQPPPIAALCTNEFCLALVIRFPDINREIFITPDEHRAIAQFRNKTVEDQAGVQQIGREPLLYGKALVEFLIELYLTVTEEDNAEGNEPGRAGRDQGTGTEGKLS